MGVAETLAYRYRGRGVAEDDLRQAAYLALIKAASDFDPDAGHDFLSYAVPTIRGVLRRHFRDYGWMVRPPRRIQELRAVIFDAQSQLAQELGRSPSMRELASHLGQPCADVEEAFTVDGCFTPTSLDSSPDSNSRVTMGDLLAEAKQAEPAADARVVLAPLVSQLCDRDKQLLRMSFFEDRTQQEMASEIGVSQTQVSRILRRILGNLRVELEAADAPTR